jgi:U4/U6 small nuclear ribonucleoprotein PRP4
VGGGGEKAELQYTPAGAELVRVRAAVAKEARKRTEGRLGGELEMRGRRGGEKRLKPSRYDYLYEDPAKAPPVPAAEDEARGLFGSLRKLGLSGSEFAGGRALTSCRYRPGDGQIVTAGWDGVVRCWDEGGGRRGELKGGHDDRICDVAFSPAGAALATTSVDTTCRVWSSKLLDAGFSAAPPAPGAAADEQPGPTPEELEAGSVVLRGHAQRVCRARFHPLEGGRYLATTSADRSWRLWDTEGGKELLLQDGHWGECYGIGFHPDGSLVSTTDFAGVVLTWDLRTGKAIQVFQGHAKRVLCAEWNRNGVELATGGDDGTVKLWDIRTRKIHTTVPAHNRLISEMKWTEDGQALVTASFDGTVKAWRGRDWRMLWRGEGHSGMVGGVDVRPDGKGVISVGFDRTFKIWA